ncbi:MAG: hypothetical protein K940chlam3_00916 [Chlamydiae bacterium]|nr:hypothetical protein [Chlamydiota bacterium]
MKDTALTKQKQYTTNAAKWCLDVNIRNAFLTEMTAATETTKATKIEILTQVTRMVMTTTDIAINGLCEGL